MLEPVPLGDEHPEELTTTRQQRVEGTGGLIGQRPGLGADALGEERQDVGVDPIGLGELAGGPGEVADLARVGHDQREPGRGEGSDRGALVSARGLQNDERRGVPIQTLDQRLDACPIIDYSPAVT